MSIKLSGAQVVRIQEFLDRYERNGIDDRRNSFFTPFHLRVEELVEDILSIVIPPAYLVKENGEICLITNTRQTQNEQRNVKL